MVLAIISKLMNWYAANRSDSYVCPMVRGMTYKTTKRASGCCRITNSELVWNACEGTFGDIVKLLLLTASGERRSAR